MKSYLTSYKNYSNAATIDSSLFNSMYELFTQIGLFWENTPQNSDLGPDLLTFMINRIEIDTNYIEEYNNAQYVIEELIEEHNGNKNAAYKEFFTSPEGLVNPPKSKLAKARQKVSNEFIAFQLTVGGFASFGGKNYPGYIAGAYIPDEQTPYRTK
jgi:hypothetical protein